jgi:hypothetical protein
MNRSRHPVPGDPTEPLSDLARHRSRLRPVPSPLRAEQISHGGIHRARQGRQPRASERPRSRDPTSHATWKRRNADSSSPLTQVITSSWPSARKPSPGRSRSRPRLPTRPSTSRRPDSSSEAPSGRRRGIQRPPLAGRFLLRPSSSAARPARRGPLHCGRPA